MLPSALLAATGASAARIEDVLIWKLLAKKSGWKVGVDMDGSPC
jgi:hypothetical protein